MSVSVSSSSLVSLGRCPVARRKKEPPMSPESRPDVTDSPFVAMCRQLGLTQANIDRANKSFEARHYVAENGCWIWTGTRNEFGYGHLSVKGRVWKAHRWAYVRVYGPVPDGLDLDHFVCDNKSCVRPDHVRPASRRENLLRARAAKTTCRKGHPYGLASFDRGSYNVCQVCKQDSIRRCQQRKTEREAARYRLTMATWSPEAKRQPLHGGVAFLRFLKETS